MVDAETLRSEQENDRAQKITQVISETVVHPMMPFKICGCSLCEDQFYRRAVKPKFSGYSRFSPLDVKELTEHQYFICDMEVQAFIFKLRTWSKSQSLNHSLTGMKTLSITNSCRRNLARVRVQGG